MAANLLNWLGKLRDSNVKEIKKLDPVIAAINELEPDFNDLDDDALKAKTVEFRARIAAAARDIDEAVTENRAAIDKADEQLKENPSESEAGQLRSRRQYLEETVSELESDARKQREQALDDILPEAFAAVRRSSTCGPTCR